MSNKIIDGTIISIIGSNCHLWEEGFGCCCCLAYRIPEAGKKEKDTHHSESCDLI